MGWKTTTINPGDQFGRLTVLQPQISKEVPNGRKFMHARVQCVCGTIKLVLETTLRAGHTQSCGCSRIEHAQIVNLTHGETGAPIHKLWSRIKYRCKSYLPYINANIHIAPEWEQDYVAFRDYIINTIGDHPGGEWSLDRIDNTAGYVPGNLRWANKQTQARNRRNARPSKLNNVDQLFPIGTQIHRMTVLQHTLHETDHGFIKKILMQCNCGTQFTATYDSVRTGRTKSCGCLKNENLKKGPESLSLEITVNNETHSLSEWARIQNILPQVIWNRIKRGWTTEKAVLTPARQYKHKT